MPHPFYNFSKRRIQEYTLWPEEILQVETLEGFSRISEFGQVFYKWLMNENDCSIDLSLSTEKC